MVYFKRAFVLLAASFLAKSSITSALEDPAGYAVLIGGFNKSELSSVEIWYPGEFSPCTEALIPPIPDDVRDFSAVVQGILIMYCGGYPARKECYSYTVGSPWLSWDPVPSMIHGREDFTLTTVGDLIIATGGYTGESDSGSGRLSSVEVFKDGRWSESVDWELNFEIGDHCAVEYGDRKLVITVGILAEQLDLTTGEWIQMTQMNVYKFGHSCVSYKEDSNYNIIVAGGVGEYNIVLDSAERFSSTTGYWQVLPRLNTARVLHSMGVLDGYPTIFGGSNGRSTSYATTEYWNGTQWVYGKQLQGPRVRHGTVIITCG